MYVLALLVSLISWTACVTLLAAEENVVEPFTFDTKLALFVSRNESEKCLPVGAASNGTNQCPANVISQYAQSFSGSPCTRIAPMQSLGSSVVEIKWGEQRFTRYPVSISASDSDKFWGGFLNNANALVLLLFVFTVSALFQTWRLMYLETTDNDLSRDEPCAYHGCQYNPANHDDATWAHLLSFRAAHGSHFSMWIEYTFTASVQLLVIAFNFQGFSVDELFFVLLIQGCLTLLGWIVENALDAMYHPCQYQHPKMLLFGQASHYSLLARAACVEILAWFLHVTLWVSMFEKYNNVKAEVKNLQKLESSPQCGHGHDIPDVPWFVDAILYCSLCSTRRLVSFSSRSLRRSCTITPWQPRSKKGGITGSSGDRTTFGCGKPVRLPMHFSMWSPRHVWLYSGSRGCDVIINAVESERYQVFIGKTNVSSCRKSRATPLIQSHSSMCECHSEG